MNQAPCHQTTPRPIPLAPPEAFGVREGIGELLALGTKLEGVFHLLEHVEVSLDAEIAAALPPIHGRPAAVGGGELQPALLCHDGGADILPPRLPGVLPPTKSILAGAGWARGDGEWAGGGVPPGAPSEHPTHGLSWEGGMSRGRCSSWGTQHALARGRNAPVAAPTGAHSLVVLVALHVELLEDDVGQPRHVAVHGLEAQRVHIGSPRRRLLHGLLGAAGFGGSA